MPTQRTTPTLPGFFKFTKIRQAVTGLIVSYKHSDNGPIVTMSPCIVDDGNGRKEVWEAVAIGLSTDLKFKVFEADRGKWVSIKFTETEPTSKGSPRKVFDVYTLDNLGEVKEAGEGADMTHRKEIYPQAGAVFGEAAEDERDELPF